MMETKRRVRCPYCAKLVTLTKAGKLNPHRDPETKNPCMRRSPA